VFSDEGAGPRFRQALSDARINVTLYKNKIRVSPSVYSDMDDMERLLKILRA
jgi:selenocysteine lyase/cysteine desulfurase